MSSPPSSVHSAGGSQQLPPITPKNDKPVVGTWTHLYNSVAFAFTAVAHPVETFTSIAIYPQQKVNEELDEAKQKLQEVVGQDAKVVEGLIDYGIDFAKKWLQSLPDEDMKKVIYNKACSFLGEGYVHSLVNMLISRTVRRLVEEYRKETNEVGELNVASFGNFLVNKLNSYVKDVPKGSDRSGFQSSADTFLKLILPNGVKDLPGGALLGNTYFTNVWEQIRQATASSLMQYGALKGEYDTYAVALKESTKSIDKDATPQDQKSVEAMLSHAWIQLFDYSEKNAIEYLPKDLRQKLASQNIDAFVKRQVADCANSPELKGFVMQIMTPVLTRAVTLPADAEGQQGIARVLSDVMKVIDSYAATHETATIKELEQIDAYELKLKSLNIDISSFEKTVLDLETELVHAEAEQAPSTVVQMRSRLESKKNELANKTKEYKKFIRDNAKEIRDLKEKTQFTYGYHDHRFLINELLGAFGMGEKLALPNPADHISLLKSSLDGMKKTPIPQAAADGLLAYKQYRAGIKEATKVETVAAAGAREFKMAKELVDEFVAITQTMLSNPTRRDQVMAYAPLVFGDAKGKDLKLMEWFLIQTQNIAFSPLVVSEVKGFLEPIVLRMQSHQDRGMRKHEQESLKKVCGVLSQKIVPLIQVQAFGGDHGNILKANRSKQFVEMFLEDYLYCAGLNLQKDPSLKESSMELLFNKVGDVIQTFLEENQGILKHILKSDDDPEVKRKQVEACFTKLSQELKAIIIPEKMAPRASLVIEKKKEEDAYINWMQEFTWMDAEPEPERASATDYLLPKAFPFRSQIQSQVEAGITAGWDGSVPGILTGVFFDTTKQIVPIEEQLVEGKEKPIIEIARLIAEQVAASLPATLIVGAPETADLIFKNVLDQLKIKEKDIMPEDATLVKKALNEGLADLFKSAAFEKDGRELLAKFIGSLLTSLLVPLVTNIQKTEAALKNESVLVQVSTGVIKALTSQLEGVSAALKEAGAENLGEVTNADLLKAFDKQGVFHVQLREEKPLESGIKKSPDQIVREKEQRVMEAGFLRQLIKSQEKLIVNLRKELQVLKNNGDSLDVKRGEIKQAEKLLLEIKAKESVAKQAFLREQVAIILRLAGIHEAKDLPLPLIAAGYDFEYCKDELFPMILEGVLDSAIDPAKLHAILHDQVEAGLKEFEKGVKLAANSNVKVEEATLGLPPSKVAKTKEEEEFIKQFNELFGQLLRCSSPVVLDTLLSMESFISLKAIFPNLPRIQDMVGGAAGEIALDWLKSNQLHAVLGNVIESALPSMRPQGGAEKFEPSPYEQEKLEQMAYEAIMLDEKNRAELPQKMAEYVSKLIYHTSAASISNAFTSLWNATVDRVCPEAVKTVCKAIGEKIKWAATCIGIVYVLDKFAQGVKWAILKALERSVAWELKGVTNVLDFDINQSLLYNLIGSTTKTLDEARIKAALIPQVKAALIPQAPKQPDLSETKSLSAEQIAELQRKQAISKSKWKQKELRPESPPNTSETTDR